MSSNRIVNTESSALEFLKSRIGDFAVQWSIYVATKLKIADLLHDGPRGADFLAENANANPRILFDVLRTLVAHEILEETEDGLFSLNEISSALQTEKFGRIILSWFEVDLPCWSKILYTVTTGGPAFNLIYDEDYYDYCSRHPTYDEANDYFLSEWAEKTANNVLNAYDFTSISGTIVDIGGNRGTLLSKIVESNPKLNGILFDRAEVIQRAKSNQTLTSLPMSQYQLVSGDFFVSVPASGDIYIAKWLTPDWDDEELVKIFGNCRVAMRNDAKLLVIDILMNTLRKDPTPMIMDLTARIFGRGQERTEEEVRQILTVAGFEVTRVIPTEGPFSIIEATPRERVGLKIMKETPHLRP
ncbi:MAG: acetylserotonin O-methyltransferase [Thaumarchaeota archaeon]|nr:acetylserotonin O-methyltransferase [Nitrososphaerota archaeon]